MTADEWLAPRLRGAPEELAAAVRGLLEDAGAETAPEGNDAAIPGRLAAAAIDGLGGVLEPAHPSSRSREVALRLLAADALLTYAFEAAVDLGSGADELAERVGPGGALGDLLLAAAEEGCP